MLLFNEHYLLDAVDHANAGGQALYVFSKRQVLLNSHAEFTTLSNPIRVGHLFDKNLARLKFIALRLGMDEIKAKKHIYVMEELHNFHHVRYFLILAGTYLDKAINLSYHRMPPKQPLQLTAPKPPIYATMKPNNMYDYTAISNWMYVNITT